MRTFTTSTAASMLIAWLAVTGVVLALALWTLPAVREQLIGVEPPAAPELIATLIAEADAEWAPATQRRRQELGPDLARGERLELLAGFAEIRFDSGARAVLQAPASLTLSGKMQTELHAGRMVAVVPPSAIGFRVSLAEWDVVDLGTEFGVAADPVDGVNVHVYHGEVEVQPRAPTPGQSSVKLTAGQSARFDGGGGTVERSGAAEEEFVRRLDPPHLARARLHPHLLAYFSFDAQPPAALMRDAVTGAVGQHVEGGQRSPGFVGAGALELTPSDETSDLPLPELEGAVSFSIELIFATEWNGRQIASLMRRDNGRARLLLALQPAAHLGPALTPANTIHQHPGVAFGLTVGGVYGETEVSFDGAEGRPRFEQLNDGRPHHLVATYDYRTGQTAIYFDGAKIGERKLAPQQPLTTASDRRTIIGKHTNEPFTGALDEFAVYRVALSAEEVKRHYENFRQGRRCFEGAKSR